jgi:uncharacterized membrane protein
MFGVVFYWWGLFFVLGLVNLPLAWLIFKKFYDRGWAFAKIIGLLWLSFLVWFFGICKILPFGSFSILLSLILDLVLNFFLFLKQPEIKKRLPEHWRIFVFEELLFLLGLVFWSGIRSFEPNIHGLEKFMDFGFVQAILRSRWLPPHDMWLAGYSINYYYFGHLQAALLTKISGVYPPIAYNLMIASLCGLMLSAGFSITSNLIDRLRLKKGYFARLFGGLISAGLLTFGGNFQLLYHWIKEKSLETYWYPDATRFIIEKFGAADNTIHEFPIYSLVVADLHGHLLNVPNVLLMIGLLMIFASNLKKTVRLGKLKKWLTVVFEKLPRVIFGKGAEISYFKKIRLIFEESFSRAPILLLLGFSLGMAFITNAWDYPIYLLYSGAVILTFHYLSQRRAVLLKTAIDCGWLLASSIVFSLPFHLYFENIAQGVALVDFHSPPWMLLFLWGWPLFLSISFLLFLKKMGKKAKEIDHFVLVLALVSWSLILVPEVLRVKDIYINSHQRANTMFKLTYQAFVVFSLLSGFIAVRLISALRRGWGKKIFSILFVVGLGILLIYPRQAIRSYYDPNRERPEGSRTLDGLSYLSEIYPDDYQAILWLNEKVTGAPVIVEAVGESYTDHARVSANTGLPTILGWRVHEWLWRGSFDIPGKRTDEVTAIYVSGDEARIRGLLEKYQVELIFVGTLERETYPNLNEEVFASLGKVIFESGGTRIYRINKN